MLAATVLDAYKALVILSLDDVPVFAVGFVTSFIFAMLAIKGLLHFLSPQLQRLRLVSHRLWADRAWHRLYGAG